MFSLKKVPFGPHEQYRIESLDGQTALHLVPGRGANLSQVVLNGQPILDGYETPEALLEAKGGKSDILFPFPNRLNGGEYTFNGKTHHFPINNPATANAIHGFVRKEPFMIDRIVLARHYASITCAYHYSGQLNFYPYPFQLDLTFSVYKRGVFRLEVAVQNLNHFDLPFGFGWHPYFKLAGNTGAHTLLLPACELIAVNERLLPTGERTPYGTFQTPTLVGDRCIDNCFAYTGSEQAYSLQVEGPLGKLFLNLDAAQFPFFQIYTPEGRNSIALEPMSCNINALQSGDGLIRLQPDEVWSSSIEVLESRSLEQQAVSPSVLLEEKL